MQDNDYLCLIENDAPMGNVFRNFWLPACMAEEVEEDGPPVRTKMLGEELVVFKDTMGQIGCLANECPHRGAPLHKARNEGCGLTCLYHGLKVNVDGDIVGMRSDTKNGRGFKTMKNYPAKEQDGFIWINMGDNPRNLYPANWSGGSIAIIKVKVPFNWATVIEASIDSSHSSTLHQSNLRKADKSAQTTSVDPYDGMWIRPDVDGAPRMKALEKPYGLVGAAFRNPANGDPDLDYIRTSIYMMPNMVNISPNDDYNITFMVMPIDNENTMFYWIAWQDDPKKNGITQEQWRRFTNAIPGETLNEEYEFYPIHWKQDREAMKNGDWTGYTGIPMQDFAVFPPGIRDRTRDQLIGSDVWISKWRRHMTQFAKKASKGSLPSDCSDLYSQIRGLEGNVPKDFDWTDPLISS